MAYRLKRADDIGLRGCGVVIFLAALFFFVIPLKNSFAATPQEDLQQILNQIPSDWWNGGWNKLAELESFIQAHPGNPDLCATAQFYIGAYYNGVKQYEKSVAAHQTLVAKYPAAKECVKSLWEIGYIQQHRLKNLSEAIQAYKQIINKYGESGEAPKAMLALGIVYHGAKQYDAAIQTYQDLLRIYPASDEAPRALLKTGIIYRELKKEDQELQAYEQVIQNYGQTKYAPEAKLLIGEYHMRADDHEKAIAVFQEMKTDYPTFNKIPQALIYMGECSRELKKWPDEIAAYQEVLKKYGSTEYAPRANYELGECYEIAKKHAAAIEVLRDLVWKYPKSEEAPRALLKIGLIYREMKKFDDELSMYQKVVEHFGSTKYARDAEFKIGEFYSRAKQYEKAIETFQELVANDPTATVAESSRALMKVAVCYLALKDADHARQTYQQVSDSYPHTEYAAAALFEIGHDYMHAGEIEKAKAYLTRVITDQLSVPGRPVVEARYVLGDIAASTGDKQEAFNQYKEAYCVTYDNVNLLKEVIDRLYVIFARLDGNYNRANRFIAYQLYGSDGEDGVKGTSDDLVDPLMLGASESTEIMEYRNNEFSQKDKLELYTFLLQKLGEFTEADAANKQLVVKHETTLKDVTSPKSMRIAALYQLLQNTTGQEIPTSDFELFKEAVNRQREKYREIKLLAQQLGNEYAGDYQHKYILDIEAEVTYQEASMYELLGDFDRSIQLYEALLTKPLTLDWEMFCKIVMAHVYVQKSEDVKAISIWRRVIADHWQHPIWPAEAHYQLALYYRDQGNAKQALLELQEIVDHYLKSSRIDTAKKVIAESK